MLRSAASKAMWVGRTTVAVIGLAIALAVVFGVATMALAAVPGDPFKLGQINSINRVSTLVGSVTGPMLKVDNNGGGPALRLEANSGKAPMVVNPTAGKATNLNADKIDGKDSAEVLPLVRAQKDGSPAPSPTQTGSEATANTVSITAPTDGFLVIWSSIHLATLTSSTDQYLISRALLDGTYTTGIAGAKLRPGENDTQNFNVTLPVSAGEHTVTTVVTRTIGSGSWLFNYQNLSVMFVPKDRGAVTDTPF